MAHHTLWPIITVLAGGSWPTIAYQEVGRSDASTNIEILKWGPFTDLNIFADICLASFLFLYYPKVGTKLHMGLWCRWAKKLDKTSHGHRSLVHPDELKSGDKASHEPLVQLN